MKLLMGYWRNITFRTRGRWDRCVGVRTQLGVLTGTHLGTVGEEESKFSQFGVYALMK